MQRAKLPRAAPTALRELFLSGLIQRVSKSAADPEDTVYDFVHATRKELIGSLTRQDALSVLVQVPRYLVSRLETRVTIAAQAVGIAQGALDFAKGYVKERKQFGKAVAEFQGIQFMLADMGMKNVGGLSPRSG
ncbi:hypothetical protein GCM10020358_49460 [Amorphoplanes nipponensis]|uniref:Acyl-CoA dehydrogenase/oxidase C-terminal domain-containing protein n=1 Tax=Actinoplanes nipponensis TaxID=135950 RepID=A0A919JLC0_9ACTN|nr:hypothetical protein Ani05nite_66630 [Actinoplanes nipponensis]